MANAATDRMSYDISRCKLSMIAKTQTQELIEAIRRRDSRLIMQLMFEGVDVPRIRRGMHTEKEIWDFKGNAPPPSKEFESAWAELAKDVLGFHNLNGGLLIFGISDSYDFIGATPNLDSKKVNDQLQRFLGSKIWVEFYREYIQEDQRYLGLAIIPPRGPMLGRFMHRSPPSNGKKSFDEGGSALREGDSTRVLGKSEADKFEASLSVPSLGKAYQIDEAFFRIPTPDYIEFVERSELCQALEIALADPRTSVTSLIGLGGVGKTALATWAVMRAYHRKQFSFIVSITAKDRELMSGGIRTTVPALSSFETLLDSILEVLGFVDEKRLAIEDREMAVREILKDSNGLLFVDNLETVDDQRIIEFLDTLPFGVRVLTTSRRPRVRVSVHPIDIGPLKDNEAVQYISSLSSQSGFLYAAELTAHEMEHIGKACSGIPLAIRWTLSQSGSAEEALSAADSIVKSNKQGELLLEFCFRRTFEALSDLERKVLQTLSLFEMPKPLEVVVIGSDADIQPIDDALNALSEGALVKRIFDPERNGYSFMEPPIVRAFVYSEIRKNSEVETTIRGRLSDWYEAKGIADPVERIAVRNARQGSSGSELMLLDLATTAAQKGEKNAKELFERALAINPKSWRTASMYAQYLRDRENVSDALQLFEQAAANAPKPSPDRNLILREWAFLLRKSGDDNSTRGAIELLEEVLSGTPNDVHAATALGGLYNKTGAYQLAIKVLAPLKNHPSIRTREIALPLLAWAYERTEDICNLADVRAEIEKLPPKVTYRW